MKKVFLVVVSLLLICSILGCSSSSSSSRRHKDDYDYDKGYGYEAPKEGQSFEDYVKDQDPELYNEIFENYNSLQ